jgi:hypothetical protein
MDLRGRTANVGPTDSPSVAVEQPTTPPPADEPLEERTARGLVEPIGQLHGEPAPEEPAAAPAPAKAEDIKLASNVRNSHPAPVNVLPRPRTVRGSSNRRGAVRSPVLGAPADMASTPATDTGPDWQVSVRQGSQSNRGPDRGTNGAPILD